MDKTQDRIVWDRRYVESSRLYPDEAKEYVTLWLAVYRLETGQPALAMHALHRWNMYMYEKGVA